ncbi:nitrate reductase [Funiculus sociatus GB2-A5]|uniref:Nitrate reductase n=1 Tax=Funiculus sociatus GB2-A5 TaxID=2933946 RepID=A0ABV0JM53_9CYAN|nr:MULTISPECIES: nitrate reductase [unclassified Trichocoleus]MBD1904006.1 nitrate reductase [Trichocoleus sp. FACHB-832]MBD2062777.1 nitrate reductase [Trichocoleus sp. FACHB-6]
MTTDTTKTLCPYCGVGCGLEVSPPAQPGKAVNRDSQGTPIWKVQGDRTHPSSQGMVCVKGATVAESLSKDRLLYPMVRDSLDEPFRRASWEEALDRVASRIKTVLSTQGPEAVCMYGSGQLQTEDYYVAQKLLKGCLGTNNFDSNSRLCMSSAVAGYSQSFGSDGPPCCYEDLDVTDCAFIIGSNTAECHPIIFNRLRKHHKKNPKVKMIVVDPRKTTTAEAADLHLAIKPGTDIDLLNGIAHLLMRWGRIDTFFIDECTSNFPAYAEVIQHYPPEVVAKRCGISVKELETAAHYWADSERVLSMWSMGVNQSSEGTAKVRTIINLHLMTAQIGKPGSGPFSLTGQPNAMGGRETGGLSHILPGYRVVKNPQHRAELEEFWQLPAGQISPVPGLAAWDIITGLETGDVGMLWIAATNPAVSLPDLERSKAALMRSPFTVYQDAYYPTETAEFAHVLLPAAQWSEKTGTMTNSERVVTLCKAFRTPPGEAKADWKIFVEVARRLGFGDKFPYSTSAEVYDEYAQVTRDRVCDMSGISHARLAAQGPLQWPLPKEKESRLPAVKRLYTDGRFPSPDGRARFGAYHSRGLAEPPDPDYPYVLTTGRLYGHWHTQTRTGRIDKIKQMHPNPFIEIHPRDAANLDVQENDLVEVQSRRGTSRFPAKVTKAISPGTVFVPMHWGALWADKAEANALTHHISCPDSLQPELKACAVQLVPVVAEKSEGGYLRCDTKSPAFSSRV